MTDLRITTSAASAEPFAPGASARQTLASLKDHLLAKPRADQAEQVLLRFPGDGKITYAQLTQIAKWAQTSPDEAEKMIRSCTGDRRLTLAAFVRFAGDVVAQDGSRIAGTTLGINAALSDAIAGARPYSNQTLGFFAVKPDERMPALDLLATAAPPAAPDTNVPAPGGALPPPPNATPPPPGSPPLGRLAGLEAELRQRLRADAPKLKADVDRILDKHFPNLGAARRGAEDDPLKLPDPLPQFNPNLGAMQNHVAFFDFNHDGLISIEEAALGMRLLGFDKQAAEILAIPTATGISAMTNSPPNTTAIANLKKGKGTASTWSFDKDGNFDEVQFNKTFDHYAGAKGYLNEADLDRIADDKSKGGSFDRRRALIQFLSLLNAAGQIRKGTSEKILTRERMEHFYSGRLFYDIRDERLGLGATDDPTGLIDLPASRAALMMDKTVWGELLDLARNAL